MTAFTTGEWLKGAAESSGLFDTLLLAHLLEHVDEGEQVQLISTYLPSLRSNGRVIAITPQSKGFEYDETHVTMVDFSRFSVIAGASGLQVVDQFSFPLPRIFGRVFTYNEYVSVAVRRP